MNNRPEKFTNNPKKVSVALLIFIGFIMALFLIINLIRGSGPDLAVKPVNEGKTVIEDNSTEPVELQSLETNEKPVLKFEISGGFIKEYNLDEFRDELNPHRVELFDPNYGKKKRYEAFALRDVLRMGFGDRWESPEYTDVAFGAEDGYTAIAKTSKLHQSGGYIAYKDLDTDNWEPVGIAGDNPGPFYLVWTGADQTTQNEYPWPWQLSSIDLIKFQNQYPKVVPEGAALESSAYIGFQIFEARCIRCHSINQQGGKVGPDLNAPRSIISYRSENIIREFIKEPSAYRYTHMPDHPDLTEKDLDNLISYFYYMNENRN